MPDDLKTTREDLASVVTRVEKVEHGIEVAFTRKAEQDRRRDRSQKRLRASGLVVALVLAGGMYRNAQAIEHGNTTRRNAEAAACERYNKSIEVDRFIINGQFDDYLLGPQAIGSPERQKMIEARRAERLRRLNDLRPPRDCPN